MLRINKKKGVFMLSEVLSILDENKIEYELVDNNMVEVQKEKPKIKPKSKK